MTPAAYYNEIDPYAAQWLRNLIAAGHIASGEVDTRSIEDVCPDDLRPFTQCHFFAGIGVWSYALRLAGWPDDRRVWTGSCPCQPFSAAGKGGGFADERHLWPAWFHLITQCAPGRVYGEQVASRDGLGWLDLVLVDLEGAGYAAGAADLCAAGVGAPHIRQRLWFVADSDGQRHQRPAAWAGALGWDGAAQRGSAYGLADAQLHDGAGRASEAHGDGAQQLDRCGDAGSQRPGPTNGLWRAADWLACRDGKWRPVEPGTFPLAHGVTGRVGRLRAYGNAINAEAAAAFIGAML